MIYYRVIYSSDETHEWFLCPKLFKHDFTIKGREEMFKSIHLMYLKNTDGFMSYKDTNGHAYYRKLT